MEDILKRLLDGESAEAIAKEFTDALNSAVKEVEAKKEAELQKTQKLMDAQAVIEETADFIRKYYPELAAEKDLAFTAEELIDILDKYLPKVVELNNAVIELDKLLAPAAASIKKSKAGVKEEEDSILHFLRVNGLL